MLTRRPVALWLSLYSLYFHLPTSSHPTQTLFHRLWPQHPTAFTVIRLQLKLDIHLPAYINNIMKECKATTRLHSGRSFNIMCREGWLPPTRKVLPTFILRWIYARYLLPSYFNHQGEALTCLRRQLAHHQPHETSNTLHLLTRQLLSLILPNCWRTFGVRVRAYS